VDPQPLAERVQALEPAVKRIAMVTFLVVVAGAVAAEFEKVTENFADVAAAALTLNVAAMAISFTIARLARLSDAQATAIAMELGVHNATLAIAVAATVSSVLTIPAAVYSVFMFVTAGALREGDAQPQRTLVPRAGARAGDRVGVSSGGSWSPGQRRGEHDTRDSAMRARTVFAVRAQPAFSAHPCRSRRRARQPRMSRARRC
jgi:hypothetical protein